jgi:hypothetical protein
VKSEKKDHNPKGKHARTLSKDVDSAVPRNGNETVKNTAVLLGKSKKTEKNLQNTSVLIKKSK